MNNFKVGDKVTNHEDFYSPFTVSYGTNFIVTKIREGENELYDFYLDVKDDNNKIYNDVPSHYFDLYTEKKVIQKFKVGDKVENIKAFYSPIGVNLIPIGTTFIIKDIHITQVMSKGLIGCIEIVKITYNQKVPFDVPASYFKLYIPKERCIICDREIGDNEPRLFIPKLNKSCCMKCEDINIKVFRVSLENEKGGYITKDKEDALEFLTEDLDCMENDCAYTIHKEEMNAIKYLCLNEFEGF